MTPSTQDSVIPDWPLDSPDDWRVLKHYLRNKLTPIGAGSQLIAGLKSGEVRPTLYRKASVVLQG